MTLNYAENALETFPHLKCIITYMWMFWIGPAHKYPGKNEQLEVVFVGKKSKIIDFQSDVHVVQWSSSTKSLLSASLLPSLSLQMGGLLIMHASMVIR